MTAQRAETNTALAVQGLEKWYATHSDHVTAVAGVSFLIQTGAFYTLLGPSGCGKTTTLRCVAGLEKPDGGEVIIGGQVVSDTHRGRFVPAHKRDIGMAFQSYAIWPHMRVIDNVAFPLRVAKANVSGPVMKRRVEEALETVALGGYENRMATQLSGGQQQRLALARAMVRRPRLLLLDEPLSNLDAKLRERMRSEVRDLQRKLGLTTLYVTHDQSEALSMSSRIAVMEGGRIVQEGTPREIYQRPSNRFVADFVGSANFLEAKVLSADPNGRLCLQTPLGVVRAACPPGVTAGEIVTLSIRPENVRVIPISSAPVSEGVNVFDGTVSRAMFLGDVLDFVIRVGGADLLAGAHAMLAGVRPGDAVTVELAAELCAILSDTHAVSSIAFAQGRDGKHAPALA